ncbi:hypothetical protein [Asticcacaulis taihuensis]|uniref:Uncharacterized protein n=1 Tax=Asticcacaulis taihuensis TaxID=260084 RepID=A0A1G4SEG7_9CAUL|nr:hypothetical protein [Asticcacaulis taihuensis]SCW67604.1 hypothetical protein SAMN02927928_2626 [Asticcacaulis taihuensis]
MDLNAISLEQALIDVETANARVIDLTRRLTSLNLELVGLRSEVAFLRSRQTVDAQTSQADLEAEVFNLSLALQSERLHNQKVISELQSRLLRYEKAERA